MSKCCVRSNHVGFVFSFSKRQNMQKDMIHGLLIYRIQLAYIEVCSILYCEFS